MNTEVVEEMLYRRAKLEEVLKLMRNSGCGTFATPYGQVKLCEVYADIAFLDDLLIAELDDLPISAVLLEIFK